jgi:hypothetical protein
MLPEARAREIADAIRGILSRGTELSTNVLRFIDTTFPDTAAESLEAGLRGEAVEHESLLALLFSPDEAAQLELEPLLACEDPGPEDESRLVELLTSPATEAVFGFPGGQEAVKVALTRALAHRYVSLLGIDRAVPAPIAAAAAEMRDKRDGLRARVLVRSCRAELSDPAARLVAGLLRCLPPGEEAWGCLGYALELLAENAVPEDIFEWLAHRKRLLVRALNHARAQRENLSRSNIETLASQGRRLVWVDEPDTRCKLAWIDRICLAGFGRIADVEPGWEVEDHFEADSSQTVADLMRRLY